MTGPDRIKTRTFRLVMILLPVLFFLLMEGALRWFEYGGNLSLFLETRVNGRAYYTLNPDVTRRYFRTIQVRAIVSNELFEKDKSTNTYRIFCLGESSTLGYPYMFNGSFPSMLRDRLATLWPQKNIEVINLGITAVNSYTVADFTHELMRYHPDALLVYCGHNEFYGALGVGSTEGLGRSRWIIRTYLALEHWRTFRLVRDAVNDVREILANDQSHSGQATVMEGMVRDRTIPFGSSDYIAAAENFRANLEDVAQTASTNGVKVVFGTLISNLKGIEPFVSDFSSATSATDRDEWSRLYGQAQASFQRGDFGSAAQDLLATIKVDSLPAKGHFLLGRTYEATGKFTLAEKEYKLARDYDGLRFRAPSEFNDIIREVARQYKMPVAESEELIANHSAHGIIGDELVVEHVHLNVEGYFLLAKAFFQTMVKNGFIAPAEKWDWRLDRGDPEYRAEVCVTPLDSVMASIRLYVLMNSWPFRKGGISVQEFAAKTDLERLAKSCLMREITWEQAHVKSAERYESQGKLREAAEEYRDLAKVTPLNPSPLLRLGQLLLNTGDDVGAEASFEKALKLSESYHAHQGIGYANLRRKDFRSAIQHFQSALQLTNGVPPAAVVETQQLLAVALASEGNLAEARTIARSIVAAHPELPEVRGLLKRIELEMSRQASQSPR